VRIVGVAALVGFVLSGQYMDRVQGHLVGMADGPRLLYRSAHIYWLFAALLNLVLGAYLELAPAGWPRRVQQAASAVLLVVPGFFVAAFAAEPHLSGLARPWARPGIYLSLAAVTAHLMGRWGMLSASRQGRVLR
jgi:MFS-type transporter involved in bile tolerance (Atg22 family)